MDFGGAVKRRRGELGISQTELAERSGISKAMLSEIECGKKNPTLRVACQVADGLDCQISDLLDLPVETRFEVLRPGDRKVLVDAASGAERHLLAPAMVRHGIQVLLYRFPAGSEIDFVGDGRGVLESVTCLTGRVRVRAGEDEAELAAGDTANYEAATSHAITSLGDEEATALIVIDSTHRGVPGPVAVAVEPAPGA